MKRHNFTKSQTDTVANLITDGANEEQIIQFAEKNLKLNKEACLVLIAKIKAASPASVPPVEETKEEPKEEPVKEEGRDTPSASPEENAPEPKEGDNAPEEEIDEDGPEEVDLVQECIDKIQSGIEVGVSDLMEDFNLNKTEAEKILTMAKNHVSELQRKSESEELEKLKEEKVKDVQEAIAPVVEGIDSLIVLIDKAIAVKRKHSSGFSRLLNAKKDLTRLKKAIA